MRANKRYQKVRWAILSISIGFLSLLLLQIEASARIALRPENPSPKPGRYELKLKSGGFNRAYSLYVPSSYEADKSVPLVMVLHGMGGHGRHYLDAAGWQQKAEKEGFIVVAPDALPFFPRQKDNLLLNPTVWNSGHKDTRLVKVDDVKFLSELLDKLEGSYSLDHDRIYVTGHSNGAGMTFMLASSLADRLAAIAPVASHCWKPNPAPSKPLPTFFLIGTEDPLVPPAGGKSELPWGLRNMPPIAETLETWAKAIGCSDEAQTIRDDDQLRIDVYKPKQGSARLEAWFIKGHGHEWPGGKNSGLPKKYMGPSVDTVKATDVIWDFFKKHKKSD